MIIGFRFLGAPSACAFAPGVRGRRCARGRAWGAGRGRSLPSGRAWVSLPILRRDMGSGGGGGGGGGARRDRERRGVALARAALALLACASLAVVLAPVSLMDYDPVPTGQTCAERADAWAAQAADEDARVAGWAGAGVASWVRRRGFTGHHERNHFCAMLPILPDLPTPSHRTTPSRPCPRRCPSEALTSTGESSRSPRRAPRTDRG